MPIPPVHQKGRSPASSADMRAPHFSVIVPVYNAESTLDRTVLSVLAQTDGDFELILIDDGSTDGSFAKMLVWAISDARICAVSQPRGGVAAARNRGIDSARGGLIAFLDADDVWSPDKLATHRARHDGDPTLDASFAQIAFVEDLGGSAPAAVTRSTVPAGQLALAQIVAENPVCTMSNLVVTREWFAEIGGFRVGMQYAEDQEWLVRSVARGGRVQGIDRLLVEYRLSRGGLSSSLARMHDGWKHLATPYADRIDIAAAEAIYLRYLARRALRIGCSPMIAARYALAGLRRSASAFLSDRHRGVATLLAVLVSVTLPAPVRARLFA